MAKFFFFASFFVLCFFAIGDAHRSSSESCEKVTSCVKPNADGTCADFSCCIDKDIKFSYRKVRGKFYQYALIPYYFGDQYKCGVHYFSQPAPNQIRVDLEEFHNTTEAYRGTDGIFTYTPCGKIHIKYTDIELPLNFKTVLLRDDIWCIMECNETGFLTKTGAGVYVYCFTRQRRPSSKQRRIIKNKLTQCGVDLSKLTYPNKANCDCRYKKQ